MKSNQIESFFKTIRLFFKGRTVYTVCCAILLSFILLFNSYGAMMHSCKQTFPSHKRFDNFLGDALPVGVYLYMYCYKQNKDPLAHDLTKHVNYLADLGFNFLYVGGVKDNRAWQDLLKLCERRRIAIIPQLDFAYLNANSIDAANKCAAKAIPFIRKYIKHPAVIAFSVKEEPSIKILPALNAYYQTIYREVPDAPLHLLHDKFNAMKLTRAPYPQLVGTDRYPFWWEFGAANNRATPRSAFKWYSSQLAAHYLEARKQQTEFQAVFTANVIEYVISSDKLKQAFYPKKLSSSKREKLAQHVERLAAAGNQGWNILDKNSYRYWKYYRPPVNCVRAMCWLAIAEGARSVAAWSCDPLTPRKKKLGYCRRKSYKPEYEKKGFIVSMMGFDNNGTPELKEYAEFTHNIQPYGKLIRAMGKEIKNVIGNPKGHEIVNFEQRSNPPFAVHQNDVIWESFQVPGYAGKIVVVVNTKVGTWCEGRSPTVLAEKDVFRIDDDGNVIDFKPFTKPRSISCQNLLAGTDCMDLETGKQVDTKDNGTFSIEIKPGKGRFLFLYPAKSGENKRLCKEFNLQGHS